MADSLSQTPEARAVHQNARAPQSPQVGEAEHARGGDAIPLSNTGGVDLVFDIATELIIIGVLDKMLLSNVAEVKALAFIFSRLLESGLEPRASLTVLLWAHQFNLAIAIFAFADRVILHYETHTERNGLKTTDSQPDGRSSELSLLMSALFDSTAEVCEILGSALHGSSLRYMESLLPPLAKLTMGAGAGVQCTNVKGRANQKPENWNSCEDPVKRTELYHDVADMIMRDVDPVSIMDFLLSARHIGKYTSAHKVRSVFAALYLWRSKQNSEHKEIPSALESVALNDETTVEDSTEKKSTPKRDKMLTMSPSVASFARALDVQDGKQVLDTLVSKLEAISAVPASARRSGVDDKTLESCLEMLNDITLQPCLNGGIACLLCELLSSIKLFAPSTEHPEPIVVFLNRFHAREYGTRMLEWIRLVDPAEMRSLIEIRTRNLVSGFLQILDLDDVIGVGVGSVLPARVSLGLACNLKTNVDARSLLELRSFPGLDRNTECAYNQWSVSLSDFTMVSDGLRELTKGSTQKLLTTGDLISQEYFGGVNYNGVVLFTFMNDEGHVFALTRFDDHQDDITRTDIDKYQLLRSFAGHKTKGYTEVLRNWPHGKQGMNWNRTDIHSRDVAAHAVYLKKVGRALSSSQDELLAKMETTLEGQRRARDLENFIFVEQISVHDASMKRDVSGKAGRRKRRKKK